MPNPSTAAESLYRLREAALDRYHDLGLSKSSREEALAEVRRIEEELDLPASERTPNHNGRIDLHEAREAHLANYRNLGLSKSSREAALASLRAVEAQLDLPADERTPDHNGRGGKHEPAPTSSYPSDKAEARRFITERGEALGWFKNGKLTKKGETAALDALIGFNAGLSYASDNRRNVGPLCFLSAVRSVQEIVLND